jgi:hypothetical protein
LKKKIRLIVPMLLLCAFLLPNSIFAAGEWRHYHPTQLILTAPTPLYDSNDLSTRLFAGITPQTVNVTDALVNTPDWYQIDTWLGQKWIYTPNAIPHEPNYGTRKLKLNETIYLYDGPFANKKTGVALTPQVVEAIDGANGYYKIKTWLGDKWIGTPGLSSINSITDITDVKKADEKIHLTVETKMYQSPTVAAKVVGALAPQTVQAFEKEEIPLNEHWYHIKSDWVGDAWIKIDSEPTK